MGIKTILKLFRLRQREELLPQETLGIVKEDGKYKLVVTPKYSILANLKGG